MNDKRKSEIVRKVDTNFKLCLPRGYGSVQFEVAQKVRGPVALRLAGPPSILGVIGEMRAEG